LENQYVVTGAAELLGFFIGPLMGRHHWIKPMRKFKKRVFEIKTAGAATALNAFDYNTRVLPVLSYVSQLVPLPRYFAFEQRVAFHVVYHAPFNTFAHSDFFQWSMVGLPSLTCGIASAAAALMRTANKTITRWRSWIPQMFEAAEAHLPTARTCCPNPLLSPDFWDSSSFAENLWWASQGCFDNPDLVSAGGEIVRKYHGDIPRSVQKKYYNLFLDNLHSPRSRIQLNVILTRRVINMFAPYEIDFAGKVILSDCFDTLEKVSILDRTKIIKTWLHGWSTSHRIKGEFLYSCILGCEEGEDSLSHYLQCPRIYGAFCFLWSETSSDPLVRCGLCNPTKQNLAKVACMFSAYHATKAQFLQDFAANQQIQISTDKFWVTFAQSLAAEAVDHALTRTLFDPVQFFNHFST